MITLSEAPVALTSEHLSLYYTRDALFNNLPVLVFYGPSTTGNKTRNSSRIQAHVYSLAGYQSFPRLTIAPSSPLYAAVNHLPAEQQGDEISRGLAMSLLSYFAAIPTNTKTILRNRVAQKRPNRVVPMMFDEKHAGTLAASMEYIEDKTRIADFLISAFPTRVLSWIDMDVILPPGTIQRVAVTDGQEIVPQFDNAGLPLYRYGRYSSFVDSLGSPVFLPTSKLQRAPSRPTAHSKNKSLSKEQKISMRRELCELIDTENNYLEKIRDLVECAAPGFQEAGCSNAASSLFPESLSDILQLNRGFCGDLQSILDDTENEAIRDIEGIGTGDSDLGSPVTQGRRRDPTGITHVAKALLRWFPKFKAPYQEYLRISAHIPILIGQISEEASSLSTNYLQKYGEQRLRADLIEPVQRLPRYSLLIDNVISLLPASHPALANLFKARDIVTDICAIEVASAMHLTRSVKTLSNLVDEWPGSLSPKGRLVAAVDVNEIESPSTSNIAKFSGVLLLFTDMVVVLRKDGESPLSAKGIMVEMDRPSTPSITSASLKDVFTRSLIFYEAFDLFDLDFSESVDGGRMRIMILGGTAPILSTTSATNRQPTRVYSLQGPYEGKAARLSEEIVKAKAEGRFPETVRDSGSWTLRSTDAPSEGLGFLVSLSEETLDSQLALGHSLCSINLSVDGSRDINSILEPKRITDIAACITITSDHSYRLETRGVDGTHFVDECSSNDITAVLSARRK